MKLLSPFQNLLHEILRRRDVLLLAPDGDDNCVLALLHPWDGHLRGCNIALLDIVRHKNEAFGYPALRVSRYLHHRLAPFADELTHHLGRYPHFALCKVT